MLVVRKHVSDFEQLLKEIDFSVFSLFVIWQSHATLSDEATNVSFLNWQSIDRYVILTLSAVASSFFNAAI